MNEFHDPAFLRRHPLSEILETRDGLLRQTRNPNGPEWMRAQARRELQEITAHIRARRTEAK